SVTPSGIGSFTRATTPPPGSSLRGRARITPTSRCPEWWSRSRAESGAGRDPEPEQRASAAGLLDAHLATVGFGHLLHDRQPKARPGGTPRLGGAPEPLEHLTGVLGRDPGPVVAHRDLAAVHGDLDLSPGRAPLRRVVDVVSDGTGEAVRVALDDARPPVEAEAHLGMVRGRHVDGGGDHL